MAKEKTEDQINSHNEDSSPKNDKTETELENKDIRKIF